MKRVFVSCPTSQGLNRAQQQMKTAIIKTLGDADLDAQLFGEVGIPLKVSWSFDKAEQLMSGCDAAVVLAFVRHSYKADDGQPVEFASEYNHYEGALAVAHKLPLLIIAEEGVSDRGITYHGGGRYIIPMPSSTKPAWLKGKAFRPYFEEWMKSVRERRDVFFGYCSKAQGTADAIIKHLQNVLNLSVLDWAVDFAPGQSILNRITEASEKCRAGIFLFTKDDELATSNGGAAPRDNVVFEAGFLMHAKASSRVLIILESGTKMPADLGGYIYASLRDRSSIDSIKDSLRQFSDSAFEVKIH